jgi:FdrA protein
MERVAKSPKPYTVCFVGGECGELPGNATAVATLQAAALDALGAPVDSSPTAWKRTTAAAAQLAGGRRWVRGLYAGGTLCAEAQAVFRAAGEAAASNAPIPGAAILPEAPAQCHAFVDLGADEFTVGRPHPMIDPAVRGDVVSGALRDPTVAAVLLDVVIGYGAHADPAGAVVACLDRVAKPRPTVIASVCGTERDPQVYSRQVEILERAGVTVAPSNAQAAALALDIARRVA